MKRIGLGILMLLISVASVWAQETKPANADVKKEEPKEKAPKLEFGHIELKGTLAEGNEPAGLFGEITETMPRLLKRLEKAANDEHLDGVVLHINSPSVGWGKVAELRRAIARIRAKKIPVVAYMESGETTDYMIACACDQIVVPESGVIMMPGLRAEVSFYKKLFDKLHIEADILRVGAFKSAAEPYTREDISPEFREQLQAVLDDHYERIVQTLVEQRKRTPEEAKKAIDTGVMTAVQAKQANLIDHVAYEDAIEGILKGTREASSVKTVKGYGKKKLDTDFSGLNGMVKLMNMMMGVDQPQRKTSTPKVAVIYAAGPIMTGNSQSDPFGGEVMGANTIIKAVRQARDDNTVKAVVLRVDSPGGSALASDLMWHELSTLKKPFVVSMGDVAASGGYYISMGADRIFAAPGTLTGSIGVVGGKLATGKFFDMIGITTSVVERGKNSGLLSSSQKFSDSERETMQGIMNEIYAQFTTKAAAGRKMPVEALEKLARGRIYTGQQALKIGLVDELGTLEDAFAYAKKTAGFKEDDRVERLILPKAVNPFEQLFGDAVEIRSTVRTEARAELLRALPKELQKAAGMLIHMETLAKEPAILMLPFQLTIR